MSFDPIPRDEYGLVTPKFCTDATTKEDFIRIQSTLVGVSREEYLQTTLAKRGSWVDGFDNFSFWNHQGVRSSIIVIGDERVWLTTKTKFDPTDEQIAQTMMWRCRV